MGGQQRHVAGAAAQRRHFEGHHVQAVIEVFAELALLDAAGQVAIGGGDHPDVDLDGFGTAQALQFALLQDAQEFGLQIHRQFADFVEEERAALGLFEAADAALEGAGEGAAHMAEELAFQQGFGEGAAVDGDEGLGAAAPARCRARAASSLPVPVSPVIRTVARRLATSRIMCCNCLISRLSPTSMRSQSGRSTWLARRARPVSRAPSTAWWIKRGALSRSGRNWWTPRWARATASSMEAVGSCASTGMPGETRRTASNNVGHMPTRQRQAEDDDGVLGVGKRLDGEIGRLKLEFPTGAGIPAGGRVGLLGRSIRCGRGPWQSRRIDRRNGRRALGR